MLLERNHITSAVYVGDTAGDEKGTRFAGLPFIYAKYGFGEVLAPDAIIEDIRELPECIKKFQEATKALIVNCSPSRGQ
jgi:phosphoglycolate phosphatase